MENVELAVRSIDNDLEEGNRCCIFHKHLTESERDEVKRIVLNNGWVSELYSYEYKDKDGQKGIIFTWFKDEIKSLRQFYMIE